MALLVSPRASANRIIGIAMDSDGGARLKVAVTAAPEGGKANAAVIALLARKWRLPRRAFTITAGRAARRKNLLVAGDGVELMRRIADKG